jgi:hypothetical protein
MLFRTEHTGLAERHMPLPDRLQVLLIALIMAATASAQFSDVTCTPQSRNGTAALTFNSNKESPWCVLS